jgi:D-alanyl-D-alanine carboxypeptidase
MKFRSIFFVFIINIIFILSLNTQKVLAHDILPTINASAAITVDVDSKDILYLKDIDKRMYPASTTKLITALLLAEKKKPSDLLTYSDKAKSQEAMSLDLPVNSKILCSDALDALLLFSANDIAYMIGENISGDIPAFSNLMNSKVTSLNLKNTHFITPNGLHDENHYSSAYDLSVIARELYKYPWIMETMKKEKSAITLENKNTIELKTTNLLLNKDGCIGGKTGFTTPAGKCLVAFYERNGRRIVGVVMNASKDFYSKNAFDDMEKIINWSYKTPKETLFNKDSLLKTVTLEYKPLKYFGPIKKISIPIIIKNDVLYYYYGSGDLNIETNINKIDVWNLNTTSSTGSLVVSQREKKESYDLFSTISTKNIIHDNLKLYFAFGFAVFLIVTVPLFAFMLKNKKISSENYISK